MFNRLFFMTIGMLLLITSIVAAGSEDEAKETNKRISHTLKKGDFKDNEEKKDEIPDALSQSILRVVPYEVIIHIANFLHEKDFWAFVCTSKPIQEIIMNYSPFFMPIEEEKVMKTIHSTPLNKIPNLILEWGRTPKKRAITQLRKIINIQESYPNVTKDTNKEELKFLRKRFKDYIKVINILYAMGDKRNSVNTFRKVYSQAQEATSEMVEHESQDGAIAISSPDLYVFHLKNASLLNPETRTFISKKYKEGDFSHFPQDNYKSEKYQENLPLLLTTKIAYY